MSKPQPSDFHTGWNYRLEVQKQSFPKNPIILKILTVLTTVSDFPEGGSEG